MTAMKIVRKTGCEIAVDEPIMPKKYWAEGDSIYEIQHRCKNKWCFNKNHVVFKCIREYTTLLNCPEAEPAKHRTDIPRRERLTYEEAQEIRQLVNVMPRKEIMEKYNVTSMIISHITAGRSHIEDKKTQRSYTQTARERRDEVWADYLRINSAKATCFKWDIGYTTFKSIFKEELKALGPRNKKKGKLNLQYSFKPS